MGHIGDLPVAAALAEARQKAADQQKLAADPKISAWVSANAGTGKTHVLVQRVLRLLLSGAAAESILCLTFTKAAAAEMSNRLIRELSRWPAKPDALLRPELAKVLDREPSGEELDFARCLFARVLDAPGGLKIMTIHAFCDRVLRRFPLEAGAPPSFSVLTEAEQRAALGEAINAVLHEAAKAPESRLGNALMTAIAYAGEDRFHDLLANLIGRRDEIAALAREQEDGDTSQGVERALRAALGVSRADSLDGLIAKQAALGPDTLIARAVAALREGGKTDNTLADYLDGTRGQPDAVRAKTLAKVLLTEKGEARADSRFITKAVREAHPGLAEELCRARDEFAALECRRRALQVAIATAALIGIGDAVTQRYEDAKTQRGALDFDGLIAKTAALFQRSDAAAWVLFRLDANLNHILVDEAQDTSPRQWALIRALTAEFFAGEGVEDRHRTLFAVGDEKQSIYGFQGAEPRQFAETGRDYAVRARAADERWRDVPLALSFRSTRAVLEAVDLVFADRGRMPGLTADAKPIRHFAHRDGEAGLVEIWPVEKAEEHEPVPSFEPFSEKAAALPPATSLANRIARQIRHWLDSAERLGSRNRPLRAGDILILVRKRVPFAAPMVKALKALGIPVAGADRMQLTEQLAVMDLIALGDCLLLPEDDLTLAALLKSPIFVLGDDDLFRIGHGRSGSLWDALAARAGDHPAYADAARRLSWWREASAREKPFEFYMARLETDGVRQALLARLGAEAGDAIDEFLSLALDYEASQTPNMQGFLQWLRASAPEVKRDMEQARDEVRVMTVHGSKGLEADIVFLADTCSARNASRGGLVGLKAPASLRGIDTIPAWLLPGSKLVPQLRDACEAARQGERDEYQRLLYVAMTRARDRLYIAGFEGTQRRDKDCWYDLVADGVAARLSEAEDGLGGPVRRMDCPQTAPAPERPAATRRTAAVDMPGWIARPAPHIARPMLLNPSRLEIAPDAAHLQCAALRPRQEALLRGRAVHRLLELLPATPSRDWQSAGARFLAAEARRMPQRERETLLAAVLAILADANFSAVFGPGSQAEVALSAELPPLAPGGVPAMISGQADRLIFRDRDILIVDFKSGAAVPESAEVAPLNYIAQLAAYRLALTRIFPEKPVRAALLWTDEPRLMKIPPALLDRGETLLYEFLRSRHLDLPSPTHQL